MRILTLVCFALFLLLQSQLWFGQGGLLEVWRLKESLSAQTKDNAALKSRNDILAAEVLDLKIGMAAVEERARNELGMVKRGETFYQVIS